jgi:polysaccharide biosynthesis transport protein
MELGQYIRLLRRWLWLIILCGAVGGALGFVRANNQPFVYRTTTTISVGNAAFTPDPDLGSLNLAENLVPIYVELAQSYRVLQGVTETLQLPYDGDVLRGLVRVQTVPGTSLMRITVTNVDPVLAADIANALAEELRQRSPNYLTDPQQQQVDVLQGQIDTQLQELTQLRELLSAVDQQLLEADLSEQEVAQLRQERADLTSQINLASANMAQFQQTLATFQQRVNSVEILEPARIPTRAIRQSNVQTVGLWAVMGAGLALGAVLLLEYLNETLRTADDVVRHLELPVLGVISRFGNRGDSYNDRLIVNMPTFSQPSEEYRTLRTNLLHTTGSDNRTYIISSASPQEGKSVTSSNLAISMALSGLRVLLVDADMRRPRVHETFELPNELGLSNLLTRRMNERDTTELRFTADSWLEVKQETGIPNLWVITSGFTPSNPTELLGSDLMKYWMQQFRKSKDIDVIIFDTPPVLAVPDSTELAASLKMNVLLVAHAGQTRRGVAQKAKSRFDTVKGDIIGVVLNQANLREENYYGYNYSYYYTPTGTNQNTAE